MSHSDPDQKGQGDRRRGVLQEAVARSAIGSNCQWCYKEQLPMIGLWHEEVDDPQAELEESHRRVAIVAELRRPGRSPVGRPRSAVSESRTKRKMRSCRDLLSTKLFDNKFSRTIFSRTESSCLTSSAARRHQQHDDTNASGRGEGFAGAPLSSCESMEDHPA